MTNPTSISVEEQIAWLEGIRRGRYTDAILATLRSCAQNERRFDYLIEWLGHNEDVSEMPVRDWLDKNDARAAIDEAIAKESP